MRLEIYCWVFIVEGQFSSCIVSFSFVLVDQISFCLYKSISSNIQFVSVKLLEIEHGGGRQSPSRLPHKTRTMGVKVLLGRHFSLVHVLQDPKSEFSRAKVSGLFCSKVLLKKIHT